MISTAETREKVKEILWKNQALQKAVVYLRIDTKDEAAGWWIINKTKNIDRAGNWILTQSKGGEDERIFSTRVLKGILKDTIAIIDTLPLQLLLQDEQLPITQYYIEARCKKTATTEQLVFKQQTLLITRPSNDCGSGYIRINLYNRSQPQLFLGECELFFIDNDTKQALLELALNLKKNDSVLQLKDIVNYISGFIDINYGRVSRHVVKKLLVTIPELNM